MSEYIDSGGFGDAGIAIIIGLFVGLLFAGLLGGSSAKHDSKPVEKPKTVQTVQKPVKKAVQKPTQKDPCAFWRTMYFVHLGKSLQSYYFVQWQSCEADNDT